jgi:hypothetical protein
MRYMFLLFNDEGAAQQATEAERNEMFGAYRTFTDEVQQAGAFQSGDALQPSSTATIVQAEPGGRPITTDGPFAESKEQLGGYYLLECTDLDEAIEWAAKIPAARYGKIEVRPVMETG